MEPQRGLLSAPNPSGESARNIYQSNDESINGSGTSSVWNHLNKINRTCEDYIVNSLE
ncbi:hypothetical protein ACP4OV_023388 [Aristida adscensionis]